MKIKIVKALYWLSLKSRWYKYWSKLYRKLFHSKYKNVKLNQYDSLEDLQRNLFFVRYQKDGAKELWDVVGSPHWVQYVMNLNKKDKLVNGALDCDDFSIYSAYTYVPKENEYVFLYSMLYTTPKGFPGFSGHMICCVYNPIESKYYAVGNWGLSSFSSYEELVKYIECDDQFIGCAVFDPFTLNVLEISLDRNTDVIKKCSK